MTVQHQPRRLRRVITSAVAVTALTAAGLMGVGSSSADLRQDVENARAYLESLEMKAAAAHGLVEEAEYAVSQVQAKMGKT